MLLPSPPVKLATEELADDRTQQLPPGQVAHCIVCGAESQFVRWHPDWWLAKRVRSKRRRR